MAGISRLQIEAATITPAAKPASERCTKSPSDFFIKNTQAEPSVVPKKGIMIPIKVSICLTAFALRFYLFLLKPASFPRCDTEPAFLFVYLHIGKPACSRYAFNSMSL